MKKMTLGVLAVFLTMGCSPTPQPEAPGLPGYTSLRPVFTYYGTYPNTDKGQLLLTSGYYAELELLYELTEHWAVGLGGGHVRIGTESFLMEPPPEGAPAVIRVEYGAYARQGLLRYYFTAAGGHIWYGENDFVDDETVVMSSLGFEVFGYQHIDLRLELGHLWAWESHYNQWAAGAGISYSF